MFFHFSVGQSTNRCYQCSSDDVENNTCADNPSESDLRFCPSTKPYCLTRFTTEAGKATECYLILSFDTIALKKPVVFTYCKTIFLFRYEIFVIFFFIICI